MNNEYPSPNNKEYALQFKQHPIWAMAFRPLYLLTALYGAIAILLWGFGYTGTDKLPAHFWHAHEMIWGYAGAIVVAFLLTAVATWTKQPPLHGDMLIVLVGLWVLARLAIFFNVTTVASGILGTLFYWLASFCMGSSVFKTQNKRNYIVVFALFMLGLTHAIFHSQLLENRMDGLLNGLLAGLAVITGFIGIIGNRIISFFTARRLNAEQITSPNWLVLLVLIFPLVSAVLMAFQWGLPVAGLLLMATGFINIGQSLRWYERAILREPMLWILHAGYLATAFGLIFLGMGQIWAVFTTLGIHLIAVGGIGMLTIGMMARTALGHTARPLYPAPKGIPLAFLLMLGATLVRAFASLLLIAGVAGSAYQHSLKLSAVLFALALLIYFKIYLPWLTKARLDGKEG